MFNLFDKTRINVIKFSKCELLGVLSFCTLQQQTPSGSNVLLGFQKHVMRRVDANTQSQVLNCPLDGDTGAAAATDGSASISKCLAY